MAENTFIYLWEVMSNMKLNTMLTDYGYMQQYSYKTWYFVLEI